MVHVKMITNLLKFEFFPLSGTYSPRADSVRPFSASVSQWRQREIFPLLAPGHSCCQRRGEDRGENFHRRRSGAQVRRGLTGAGAGGLLQWVLTWQ